MPVARGRIRPPRPAAPPARTIPSTLLRTVDGTFIDLSLLRAEVRKYRQDLIDRADSLSTNLALLVLKLQEWDGDWRTRPNFNSVGEVQGEGGRIDNLCGLLWAELRAVAFMETGDSTAIYNLHGQYTKQVAEQATDPSSSGPG